MNKNELNPLQAIRELSKKARDTASGKRPVPLKKKAAAKTAKADALVTGTDKRKESRKTSDNKKEKTEEMKKALKPKKNGKEIVKKTGKETDRSKADNKPRAVTAGKKNVTKGAEPAKNGTSKTPEVRKETLKKAADKTAVKKAAGKTDEKKASGSEENQLKPVSKDSRKNETDKKKKETADKVSVKKAHVKTDSVRKPAKQDQKVRIIPLGGLEQIGLNITILETDESLIVIDCGIAFPTDEMPGIDHVIPDVSYLKDRVEKVRGFVITHGHEDHIGALPYVLRELNVPVYGTGLTIALIRHKLEEAGILDSARLETVNQGDNVTLGDFRVEFIRTNHSIPDASALAVFTPAGIIFHTGDFKIDYTPVFGDPADLQRMAEIGQMGCLALLCDSTNAVKEGSTPSERNVGHQFDVIFSENRDRRIIIASFASNVDRVQQAINTAHKFGRKVVIEGRSMVTVIDIASELGYISIPEGTIIDIDELKNYSPRDTVIITTGSQGESMAALSRMAQGTHRKVSISSDDVVIMSSKPIPGNENAEARVVNDLYMKGANVILHDTHVSGHACAEDIKLIYSLLRPKFALPVHGEYMHRVAQKEIAESLGYGNDRVILMASGDITELTPQTCLRTDHFDCDGLMVDGLGIGDVGSSILKDRQNLSQNGMIIISAVIDASSGEILNGPDIASRGFIYMKENEELIAQAREAVCIRLEECRRDGVRDEARIRTEVKDVLSSFVKKRMKRTPLVIPVIMQIDV